MEQITTGPDVEKAQAIISAMPPGSRQRYAEAYLAYLRGAGPVPDKGSNSNAQMVSSQLRNRIHVAMGIA